MAHSSNAQTVSNKPLRQHISKQVCFSAAHYYHRPEWSVEKNNAVFGLCANLNGHGHNYRVTVTLEGPVDGDTGMLINFDTLTPLLEQHVVTPLDHKHLNQEVAYFKGRIPTLENIALYLWETISPLFETHACDLVAIRVDENDDLYAIISVSKQQRATAA